MRFAGFLRSHGFKELFNPNDFLMGYQPRTKGSRVNIARYLIHQKSNQIGYINLLQTEKIKKSSPVSVIKHLLLEMALSPSFNAGFQAV